MCRLKWLMSSLQAFYYGHVDVKVVPGGLRTHSGIIYPQSGQY